MIYRVFIFFLIAGMSTLAADFPPVDALPERPELSDPFVMLDGTRVETLDRWYKQRRPELKRLFQHYVYGYLPPPTPIQATVVQENSDLFGGKATFKQVEISFPALPDNAPRINLALFVPNEGGPAPCILALNKCGNHTVTDYPGAIVNHDVWRHAACPPTEELRGWKKDFWAVEQKIDRGYAFATFHESDIDPDQDDFTDGIHPFFPDLPGPEEAKWGTISAWAWGLQRCLDYLIEDPDVNGEKVIVTGHSRRGKTALWAAAYDDRFAIAMPHQSGTGGMALSRNNDEETVERINTHFPHWFNDVFNEFNGNESKLPVDQHLLVALVAPRPLLDTGGLQDTWANYESALRNLNAANPVYEFLGKPGLVGDGMVVGDEPINGDDFGTILQYRRDTKHTWNAEYWDKMMDFADLHFERRSLELSGAVIVPVPSEGVVLKAAVMLRDELAERTGVSLPIADTPPASATTIAIGTVDLIEGVEAPAKAEAYGIAVDGSTVNLVGHDVRGAMFAAGRLIRLVDCADGSIALDLPKPIATAPDVPIRAHQLAYRNTANTYDAWTVDTYEQYIRDLILFGCNGIEIIPNLDPEAKDGPVMTESMQSMNLKLSQLFGSYGIDVWLWSPVMADHDEDVTTPEGAAIALEKRRKMFGDFPFIDHVFVPGGDDGDTPAEHLIPFLEKLAPILVESHSNAKLWVSNQTFTLEENDYFFGYLETVSPDWLTGVVYGPWTKLSWEEMRERTPAKYPLRRYPDINHTLRCQYPVRDWDPVFANTVGREPMMPMPKVHKHIYLRYRDITDGFGTYSDGVHDDLNKVVWGAYGWDPDTDLDALLEEYGKVWWGPELARDVAKGLFMLEENWVGPILENTTIPKTLALWESIAERCTDFDTNWRAQMYLFRARFDAYVQEKARAESFCEKEALAALAKAPQSGVDKAIADARAALALGNTPIVLNLRKGIEDLGPVLLKSIGYQLSVKEPYKARNPERGAMLDWLDQPVNDRPWLEQRFEAILAMDDRAAQLDAIDEIVHWTDPGPGGYYDNLGTVGQYSHVVYQQSWEEDPSACHSPRVAFPMYKADKEIIAAQNAALEEANAAFKEEDRAAPRKRQELRMSWQSQMTAQFGTPLKMRYEGLDPNASYRLKVTYAGRYRPTMTLTLNDTYGVHGPVKQPNPIWPVEYYLPHEATKGGTLDLEWNLVDGRGCMVSEVWLIKN